MRELKQTGWMHNRVRMVVAQFLIKICYVIGALVKLTLCDIWWILTSGPIMVVGSGVPPLGPMLPPISVCLILSAKVRHDPDGLYICRFIPD